MSKIVGYTCYGEDHGCCGTLHEMPEYAFMHIWGFEMARASEGDDMSEACRNSDRRVYGVDAEGRLCNVDPEDANPWCEEVSRLSKPARYPGPLPEGMGQQESHA